MAYGDPPTPEQIERQALDDFISDYLFRLSNEVYKHLGIQPAAGGGGVGGYAPHFANGVFEMHPYFWEGSCCFERCADREGLDAPELSHLTLLDREEMALSRGLGRNPDDTCMVPTLKGPQARCGVPNFATADGFSVEWYKYIGRGTRWSARMEPTHEYVVAQFTKCFESLGLKCPTHEELVGEQGSSQQEIWEQAIGAVAKGE